MKDQYFGDVGDYGKFGLLRFFSERDISIAVNWYLTADDGSRDGRHISYLEKKEYFKYDSMLYVFLREKVIEKQERSVSLIENSELLPGTVFYNEMLEDPLKYIKKEREDIRKNWHEGGLEKCAGAELVFLDPDNGFRTKLPKAVKDQPKSCYANEVADYYNSGSNVCFYTHKGRRTPTQWTTAKKDMAKATPDAIMMGLTFHKGTQRSFIFAVHPQDEERYRNIFDTFLHTNWKDMFTVEEMP